MIPEISKNNDDLKAYLKEKYDYAFCSTILAINFAAFDKQEADATQ